MGIAEPANRRTGETAERRDGILDWRLVWFLAILPFLGFWLTGLFDLDEGFYGAVAAEMNRRGEWLTPYYNGQPWFEKPILIYWLAKPFMLVFGSEFGARLPSVLCSLATMGMVAWFCRRHLSERTAQLAVLILAGSLIFVAPGRMMLTDPALSLALAVACFSFYESLVGDRRWRLLTALALGVSALAKGPVGLILFIALAVWTFWRQKEMRPSFRGYWLAGTLILAAVIATWYLPAYLAHQPAPGQVPVAGQHPNVFVQRFLIEQNLSRFSGGDEAHRVTGLFGLVFFPAILLVGMLPWSLWIFRAWPRPSPPTPSPPEVRGGSDPVRRYLATWFVVVLLFFTISGSKLIHYILPALPPLAILIAMHLAERKTWRLTVAMPIVICAVANVGFWGWYKGWFPGAPPQAEAHRLARHVRDQGGDVALFRLAKQPGVMPPGGLKLNETKLPSLLMILDKTALETDRVEDLVLANRPLWIITRQGRIGNAEIEALEDTNRHLRAVEWGEPGGYALFKLELLRLD